MAAIEALISEAQEAYKDYKVKTNFEMEDIFEGVFVSGYLSGMRAQMLKEKANGNSLS